MNTATRILRSETKCQALALLGFARLANLPAIYESAFQLQKRASAEQDMLGISLLLEVDMESGTFDPKRVPISVLLEFGPASLLASDEKVVAIVSQTLTTWRNTIAQQWHISITPPS